jgi:hypothetical protein
MVTSLLTGAILGACAVSAWGQATVVHITGTVTDSAGTTPIASATVKLETLGATATTDASGAFTLNTGTGILPGETAPGFRLDLEHGRLHLELPSGARVSVQAFGLGGRHYGTSGFDAGAGSHSLALPPVPPGLCFFRVKAGNRTAVFRALSVDGGLHPIVLAGAAGGDASALTLGKSTASAATAATAIYDVLIVEKAGYQKAYVTMTNSDSSGVKIKLLKEGAAKFSFFLTSQAVLEELSKSDKGFGGNLSFGESGPGAGLRGADKLCAVIAERSMPGSSVKGWRAFLSVTADAKGKKVDAITRIGEGPWYDRVGRVFAPKKADLLNPRPMNGDAAIQNDFPNEFGIPNHDPGTGIIDNHNILTGSTATGTADAQGLTATCQDWTSAVSSGGRPRCGVSWPRGSSIVHWISVLNEGGCAPGATPVGAQSGPSGTVGNLGGYGGFYCFALNP